MFNRDNFGWDLPPGVSEKDFDGIPYAFEEEEIECSHCGVLTNKYDWCNLCNNNLCLECVIYDDEDMCVCPNCETLK